MNDVAQLSPLDAANLLAGHAVAEAETYLADRRDASLEVIAAQLWQAHDIIARRPPTPDILVPVRLLITAMVRVARTDTDERRARWRRVMAALTDLVRHESLALRANAPPEEPWHSLGEAP